MNISRAFTIVETLVAIAIIMVVLIAPFHTAEEALNAASISRDELIGDSLAQEGIEYVRSIRDSNYLWNQTPATPVDWLGGLDGTSSGSIYENCFKFNCAVNPIDSAVYSCASNCSDYPLYLGSIGPNPSAYAFPGIYNLGGAGISNIETRFTRYIRLTVISPSGGMPATANEVEVTSTVIWTTNGQAHSTTLTDYLQNYL